MAPVSSSLRAFLLQGSGRAHPTEERGGGGMGGNFRTCTCSERLIKSHGWGGAVTYVSKPKVTIYAESSERGWKSPLHTLTRTAWATRELRHGKETVKKKERIMTGRGKMGLYWKAC